MRTKQKHKIKKLTGSDYNEYLTKIAGGELFEEPKNEE